MKLIDKDAVVATIKKHEEEERHSYFCKCLLLEIDTLEVKEQPSLPSDLDEAAEEFASNAWLHGGVWHEAQRQTFKAGAKWMMAKQNEAARHVYESWMGGTMDDVRRDMVTLGTVLNVRNEK